MQKIIAGKNLFKDFKVVKDRPVYIQLKDYLKKMIMKGHLLGDQKIPSTRELSELLSVSRNTVLAAYADLEQEGLIYAVKGKGNFVAKVDISNTSSVEIDWKNKLNTVTLLADELDLMKHGVRWEKGMIVLTASLRMKSYLMWKISKELFLLVCPLKVMSY